MIYKNIEIHNVAELETHPDGITWKRFPSYIASVFEKDTEGKVATDATGVELRFIIKGEAVTLKMASMDREETCTFHVYRGSIQGGWEDHEINKCITASPADFVIKKSSNIDMLRRISNEAGYEMSAEIVRVIFDRGHIKLMDVIGDVEPPQKEQTCKNTILFYGSSITHGSNSIDMSHSWSSITAHRLNMDYLNFGMAGSCCMEGELIDYIAGLGKQNIWNIAVMELGINVVEWDDEKILKRALYAIDKVSGDNPDKLVFVISPFYCSFDFYGEDKAAKWRTILEDIVSRLNRTNVVYISGLGLLGAMSLISADGVHPNIYGVQGIADGLSEIIKSEIIK